MSRYSSLTMLRCSVLCYFISRGSSNELAVPLRALAHSAVFTLHSIFNDLCLWKDENGLAHTFTVLLVSLLGCLLSELVSEDQPDRFHCRCSTGVRCALTVLFLGPYLFSLLPFLMTAVLSLQAGSLCQIQHVVLRLPSCACSPCFIFLCYFPQSNVIDICLKRNPGVVVTHPVL